MRRSSEDEKNRVVAGREETGQGQNRTRRNRIVSWQEIWRWTREMEKKKKEKTEERPGKRRAKRRDRTRARAGEKEFTREECA